MTGSEKVSLIALSFGGTIVSSYIYKYGTADIKNIVYGSTAFCGVELVGRLFSGDPTIKIGDALVYLASFLQMSSLLSSTIDFGAFMLDGTAGQKLIDSYLKNMVGELADPAYDGVFYDTYARYQGIWTLMPAGYYEAAKENMKSHADISEKFFSETDEYFLNVQTKIADLFAEAKSGGTHIYLVGAYGYAGIPLTDGSANHTDTLIESSLMTGGTTVAPYGKTLDDIDYEKGDNSYISADNVIDAGTGILPEQTWFIRNMGHVGSRYE